MSGLLAFQVHPGHPMLVQFRNIQLQPLGDAAKARCCEDRRSYSTVAT